MRLKSLVRSGALFATAAVGLLSAHELDYRLIVPDPRHRHDLLLRTGHSYLQHVLVIALAAAALATFTGIALGFSRARRDGARGDTVASVALRLALLQGGCFVLLESIERLLVGAPADDRLLLVTLAGVALQGVAAVAGALLLTFLERLGAAVARAFARPLPHTILETSHRAPLLPAPRPSRLRAGLTCRGPPAPTIA